MFTVPDPDVKVESVLTTALGSGSDVFLFFRRLFGGVAAWMSLVELSEDSCCLFLSSSSVKWSSVARSLASSSSIPSSAEAAFSDSLSEPAALPLDPSSSLPLPVPSDPNKGQRNENTIKYWRYSKWLGCFRMYRHFK